MAGGLGGRFDRVTPICFVFNHTQRTSQPFWSDKYKLNMAPVNLLSLHMLCLPLFAQIMHQFLLRHLRQPLFISQILAGIIFGPSVLGRTKFVRKLFPVQIHSTMDTLALFSSMFFLFKVGVKTDPTMIKRSGKKVLAIGFLCYTTSLLFGVGTNLFLDAHRTYWAYSTDGRRRGLGIKMMVISVSTSFPVVANALTDLNIINSDLGHLATSTSMITDLCHLAVQTIIVANELFNRNNKELEGFLGLALLIGYFVFTAFVVRPASFWVIRKTPEGEPVKEIYIFCILALVLVCGFLGEITGQNAMVGTFLLGLAIPEGPPLGSALVEKLDYLVTRLFMPLQIGIVGLRTNVYEFFLEPTIGIPKVVTDDGYHLLDLLRGGLMISLACFVGKMVGVLLPALCSNVPLRDALLLGLVMNIKGIVELTILNIWTDNESIDIRTNTVMVLVVLLSTGTITPLLQSLYDPSKRYMAYRGRTSLAHVETKNEIRVVICVHNQDDVPPIIRHINCCTTAKPINLSIYLLHLVELVGRSSAVLIPHPPKRRPSPNPTKTERIINVFRRFEQQHKTQVSLQAFSTISPYSSMHNDICNMAIDKRVSLILLPFHKEQKTIDAEIGQTKNYSLKKILTRNLLDRAPSTVGILVDLSGLCVTKSCSIQPSTYRVVVLFLGGADDREALAYAMHMVEHPSVSLTVIRFIATLNAKGFNMRERILDNQVIDHFRNKMMSTGRTIYKEEQVKDGVELSWAIQSMKDDYDLVMVGRTQTTNPNLTAGIDEWNECEELGIIGDLLASTDIINICLLLVVQQQQQHED